MQMIKLISPTMLILSTMALLATCGDDGGGGSQKKPPPHLVLFEISSDRSCVLLSDDSFKCWGDNENGELGTGNFENSPHPVRVTTVAGARVKAIGFGGEFTCAVLDDGSLACWGRNEEDQLGPDNGETCPLGSACALTPIYPPLGSRSVKALSTGSRHSCAILDDDTLVCWGVNAHGSWESGIPPTGTPPPG